MFEEWSEVKKCIREYVLSNRGLYRFVRAAGGIILWAEADRGPIFIRYRRPIALPYF